MHIRFPLMISYRTGGREGSWHPPKPVSHRVGARIKVVGRLNTASQRETNGLVS